MFDRDDVDCRIHFVGEVTKAKVKLRRQIYLSVRIFNKGGVLPVSGGTLVTVVVYGNSMLRNVFFLFCSNHFAPNTS